MWSYEGLSNGRLDKTAYEESPALCSSQYAFTKGEIGRASGVQGEKTHKGLMWEKLERRGNLEDRHVIGKTMPPIQIDLKEI